MLKVVLDTNIFVSSLLSKAGSPAMVIDTWRAGEYLLVISPAIISEIKRVVETPKIRKITVSLTTKLKGSYYC